jgi:hypothetical protein
MVRATHRMTATVISRSYFQVIDQYRTAESFQSKFPLLRIQIGTSVDINRLDLLQKDRRISHLDAMINDRGRRWKLRNTNVHACSVMPPDDSGPYISTSYFQVFDQSDPLLCKYC